MHSEVSTGPVYVCQPSIKGRVVGQYIAQLSVSSLTQISSFSTVCSDNISSCKSEGSGGDKFSVRSDKLYAYATSAYSLFYESRLSTVGPRQCGSIVHGQEQDFRA